MTGIPIGSSKEPLPCPVCGVEVVPKALPADGDDCLLACPECGLLLGGVSSGKLPIRHEGRTYNIALGTAFTPPPGVLPEASGRGAVMNLGDLFQGICDHPVDGEPPIQENPPAR